MNTSPFRSILYLSLLGLVLVVSASTGLAQGSLTPPGPPAPTMKTLQQAEPRTPIESLPFAITQSGSYYFTKNLQFTAVSGDAITVATSDVTIDLMGFTLSSAAEVTGSGIAMNNGTHCTVKNGNIVGATSVDPFSNWNVVPAGFNHAVFASGESSSNVFIDLIVSKCRTTALSGGPNSRAVRCLAHLNGGIGIIVDLVTECTAADNASQGIAGEVVLASTSDRNKGYGIAGRIVSDCLSQNNGGNGIDVTTEVSRCVASNNGAIGIFAFTVKDCTAHDNKTHGIQVFGLAKDNAVSGNGSGGSGAGIYFSGDGVRIEGNNCYDNDWGIQSFSSTNGFIVRNSCRGNNGSPTNSGASGNYDFDRASNTYGPVVTVNGDLSANATASNPWANIQY